MTKCVCDGNWRLLVEKYDDKIGNNYVTKDGVEMTFFGLVWSDDDLYFGMITVDTQKQILYSCVGDLDSWELSPVNTRVFQNTTDGINHAVGLGGNVYVWSWDNRDIVNVCDAIGKSSNSIYYHGKHHCWVIRLKSSVHKNNFISWLDNS